MKKLGKFIFGTLSVATLAAGAYYLYKNVIKKDSSDDFDEFEDDFEDFETEDEDTEKEAEGREYVSINITSENEGADVEAEETSTLPEDEQ